MRGPWFVEPVEKTRDIRENVEEKQNLYSNFHRLIRNCPGNLSRFESPFQTQLKIKTKLHTYYTIHDSNGGCCRNLEVWTYCPNLEVCLDHTLASARKLWKGERPTKNAMVIGFCTDYVKIPAKIPSGNTVMASVFSYPSWNIFKYPILAPAKCLTAMKFSPRAT